MMLSAAVPTLDALALNPTLAIDLTADVRHALTLKVAAVLVALAVPASEHAASSEPPERLGILTTKHLGALWRMPEAKIRELCRAGTLPARKLGPKEWVIAADALRDWLPRAPLVKQVSPGLSSPRDPERGSQAPQVARPYSVIVRPPARRPQNHGGQVGSGDEGAERHDRAVVTHHRAAGTAGTRAALGDDSRSKGALT
jgi:hypothetical protein